MLYEPVYACAADIAVEALISRAFMRRQRRATCVPAACAAMSCQHAAYAMLLLRFFVFTPMPLMLYDYACARRCASALCAIISSRRHFHDARLMLPKAALF